jgi:hypothetical protein
VSCAFFRAPLQQARKMMQLLTTMFVPNWGCFFFRLGREDYEQVPHEIEARYMPRDSISIKYSRSAEA